jgi:erythromycin esterase
MSFVPKTCEDEVISMLSALRRELPDPHQDAREEYFVAEQNALVVKNAETYYRAMVRGGAESWNVRDRHMVETLERLMRFHGAEAKAIVWEHNTHIGDARATDMARNEMVNVGQLIRESHRKEDVVLVGFASHRGSVIAGEHWGAPMERMTVPEAQAGSWEDVLHQAGGENQLLLMDDVAHRSDFLEPRGHRAIGVVYDPEYEQWGNYVPTVLPERYDALMYVEESHALHPLHITPQAHAEPPETYPWNV